MLIYSQSELRVARYCIKMSFHNSFTVSVRVASNSLLYKDEFPQLIYSLSASLGQQEQIRPTETYWSALKTL